MANTLGLALTLKVLFHVKELKEQEFLSVTVNP